MNVPLGASGHHSTEHVVIDAMLSKPKGSQPDIPALVQQSHVVLPTAPRRRPPTCPGFCTPLGRMWLVTLTMLGWMGQLLGQCQVAVHRKIQRVRLNC